MRSVIKMLFYMKKIVWVAFVGISMALASCSGEIPGKGLFGSGSAASGSAPPPGFAGPADAFYDTLAGEYKNLAAYEEEYLRHASDAAHFLAKSNRARQRQDVAPDNPEDFDLPPFARQEIAKAWGLLDDALRTRKTAANKALLALAQSRYDCWLSHREDFPQAGAYLPCRDQFYESLALLEDPPSGEETYSLYFESNSTVLDEETRQTVKDVAERYADLPGWDVILKGYTDGKGDRQRNKALSLRRAVAVKHMLAQYGLDLDSIAVSAEGEVAADQGGEEGRNFRRVDIWVRPHDENQKEDDLAVAPEWKHTGEF